MKKEPELSESEIALRMNSAVRRALNTPPKPLKKVIGKGRHASAKRKRIVSKAGQSDPESP